MVAPIYCNVVICSPTVGWLRLVVTDYLCYLRYALLIIIDSPVAVGLRVLTFVIYRFDYRLDVVG